MIICLWVSSAMAIVEQSNKKLTRADVATLIENQGKTPPDWWDSVQLNYPPTLDLNWPMKAPDP